MDTSTLEHPTLRTRPPWGTAYHYAKVHGWHVVPYYTLGPDGQCNCSTWHKAQHRCHTAKHPRPRNGYKAATGDLQTISRWTRQWPQSNIAVATGQSRLIAFDPDNSGAESLLAELQAEIGPLPKSWAFQSGSGYVRHVFRLPEGVTLRKGYVTRGTRKLEVIGEGATLLIAGIHKTGKPYVDLSPKSDGAELPAQWVEFLQRELPTYTVSVPRNRCAAGNRNDSLYSKDETDADPVSLTCFYRLWERKHQTTNYPQFGQSVLCWAHTDDQHPSGSFYVSLVDRRVHFRCYHENRSWPLAYVYARVLCGVRDDRLSRAQLALFDTRMQLDCGVMCSPDVAHTPLPADAPEIDQRLYVGFLNVMACKWVKHPGEPTTFSRSFARVWCGLPDAISDRQIDASWHRLCDRGHVLPVETIDLGDGRPAKQYLPFPPMVGALEGREIA
jgi:hypothetical protein